MVTTNERLASSKETMQNRELKKRILDISFKYKLSHIASCVTAVDIINEIYETKKPNEKFVLSSGHAGLALYVTLEARTGKSAEEIFLHHGVHPDRCRDCGISCSSGSLGHGLAIAVGMALADRSKECYSLISDGECSEGSIWEALRIAEEQHLLNLNIYVNYNGWGAYKEIPNYPFLEQGIYVQPAARYTNMYGWPTWLQGQNGHYAVMDEKMYKEALECLK